MKPYSLIAAALLAVLNGLLLIPAMSAYTFRSPRLRWRWRSPSLCFPSFGPREAPAPPPAPVVAQPPPAPPENQAEAEVVAFVGLLQEKGRFVDFLMDDVALYNDAQVGAAASVVHYGCRDVLQ